MKYFLVTFLVFLFSFNFVLADNAYYADTENTTDEYFYITDASQTGLDFADDFTIEGWVYLETLFDVYTTNGITGKWTDSSRGWNLFFNDSSGDRLMFEHYGEGEDSFIWEYDFDVATWYHIAVTVDLTANEVLAYLNGSEMTLTSGVSDNTYTRDTTAKMALGHAKPDDLLADYGVDARLDEFRYWQDVRTEQEIQDNYECNMVGDETDLVALYSFDGQNGEDETSNSNDFVEVNTPTYSASGLPFTAECGATSSPPVATTTPTVGQMPIENDLTVITWLEEIYTDSTTTPSEIRKGYAHIPFFGIVFIVALTFFIMERIILEIIIRYRK